MEKFDASEFTAEFDFERFKAGEHAVNSFGDVVVYVHACTEAYITVRKIVMGIGCCEIGKEFIQYVETLKMRPATPAKDDGWIKIENGQCPEVAKGWKAKELEFKWSSGDITKSISNVDLQSYWQHWVYEGKPVAIRRRPMEASDAIVMDGIHYKSKYPPRVTEDEMKVLEEMRTDLERVGARNPFRQLSQNEVMAIAGRAINGMETRVVEVERDVVAAIRRDW